LVDEEEVLSFECLVLSFFASKAPKGRHYVSLGQRPSIP